MSIDNNENFTVVNQINRMQKRIQQLRNDYEKAEETSKKYKVINEQLRNKIRKMKVYIIFILLLE